MSSSDQDCPARPSPLGQAWAFEFQKQRCVDNDHSKSALPQGTCRANWRDHRRSHRPQRARNDCPSPIPSPFAATALRMETRPPRALDPPCANSSRPNQPCRLVALTRGWGLVEIPLPSPRRDSSFVRRWNSAMLRRNNRRLIGYSREVHRMHRSCIARDVFVPTHRMTSVVSAPTRWIGRATEPDSHCCPSRCRLEETGPDGRQRRGRDRLCCRLLTLSQRRGILSSSHCGSPDSAPTDHRLATSQRHGALELSQHRPRPPSRTLRGRR